MKGGTSSGRDMQSQVGKQIKILENRIDKANQKFSEAINTNKQLREDIDNLRRERVVFDNIYSKLEKDLNVKRKDMAKMIDMVSQTYQNRDKAQNRLQSMIQTDEGGDGTHKPEHDKNATDNLRSITSKTASQ